MEERVETCRRGWRRGGEDGDVEERDGDVEERDGDV